MSQSCFTSEVYALYAIGSLDGVERGELESHARRGCDACLAELAQARQFWTAYAAAVPAVAPPARLKRKILSAVQPQPAVAWWWQAVAAALVLAAGIGVGWKIHPTTATNPAVAVIAPTPAPVATLPPAPATSPDQLRTLEARIDQLNAALADREKQIQALASRPPSPSQPPPSAPDLQPTLDALRAENAQRAQLLRQAEDRAAQLTAEIQRVRDQSADRESRLRADYTARIRTLENESAKLQRVVDAQQRRIDQNAQLVSFFSSPNLRVYQYKGTNKGPAATARVVVQEGSRALFYAFHLPQLPAGRTYQLWLIRGQAPAVASGGTFRPDADGNAVVEFTNPALTRDVRQFAVTDEPASGSQLPTGNQYFRS